MFLYSQIMKMVTYVIYILSISVKFFSSKKFHIIFSHVGSCACKNHKRASLCLMMPLISFVL